jgi:2-(1,2-epoxy-1,2-dihydrophenyl)acetyl-CoA isomerase
MSRPALPNTTVPRRFELTLDDGLARLRLVRPDGVNAIDPEWVVALGAAVEECERAAGVRALLISADGTAFSVGGDLRHFDEQLHRLPDALEEMIGPYHQALGRMAELPVPVVCAVHGAAAGGALGLLWCADVVLVAEDAKLATGFSRLGLSGDGGSSWWLPRLVGMVRARELMLGGRVLSGAEAVDWGLATRVVPADRLEDDALAAARELATGPTVAYGEMRRLLARSLTLDVEAGLTAELAACLRTGATADARAGIRAFAGRHDPHFQGC